jgi:two-component system sensor histidine kinase EvgS
MEKLLNFHIMRSSSSLSWFYHSNSKLKKNERLVAALFCVILLLSGSYSAAQDAHIDTKPPILSASEIAYPPFCIVDENGAVSGFSNELLIAALKAMGRSITFRTGPWEDVRGWLEKGEVQVLPLVGRTPERESLFEFTVPYMALHGAIVVRKDTTDIGGMEDLRGRRVATMRGDNAEEFLRREDRGIDILTTPTFEDSLRALSDGTCDAVVIQRLVALRLIKEMGLTSLRVINKPIKGFRQDWSFAVKEGDKDNLALLNEGLALVIADGTYAHLHSKWFAALELPSQRRLVIGGDHNYPPFEFLDDDGRPSGYSVELARAIAQEVGLDIEIKLGPWSKIREQLANGEIDAVSGMVYSPERNLIFDFTPPHSVIHNVSVIRKGEGTPPSTVEDLKGKRIVIQRGDIMDDFAEQNGLSAMVSRVDSQEDALRKLSEGEYDCTLVSRSGAYYWIKKKGWRNLEIGKHALISPEYSFAVRKHNKPLLAQLTEGLQILNETGEYKRIHDKWMGVYKEDKDSLLELLRKVAMILIPLLLLLLVALLWSWSLRKKVASTTHKLLEREIKYRLLAENTIDVIWTMSLDLEITYVNPAVFWLTGQHPEEWIGTKLSEHCDAFHFAQIRSIITREMESVSGKRGVIFETEILDKSKQPIPVEIHGKIIFDANGSPVSLQGVTRDIRERKRAEFESQKLTNQLQQAMKMEAIGRLAGGIAHDFNNLLTGITGNIQLSLMELTPGTPLHDTLSDVAHAADSAATLTRQLLAFSRKQLIEPKTLNLNDLISGLQKLLSRLIREDVELQTVLQEPLSSVKADSGQFEQILINLAINARDAMPNGGKLIIETADVVLDDAYCQKHPHASPGNYVRLAVSDTGTGMTEDVKSHVFEPFFTTKPKGLGTGLGLATIYGAVKQAGGTIEVYSEVDLGTTFKIYLPSVAEKPETLAKSHQPQAMPTGTETILIVEDEKSVREMAIKILTRLGYKVLSASDGTQAIATAEGCQEPINLLMTDVVMPGMNGRQIATRLSQAHPEMKILYTSGYTENIIAHHGVIDEGLHFIGKPYTPQSLAQKLREVIEG